MNQEEIARLRRSAAMAPTTPTSVVRALLDEVERLRDLSERRFTARRESLADAIEATISESGAETIDELRAAVRGRPPREPWDGEPTAGGVLTGADADINADISRRAAAGRFADELLADGQTVVYLVGDDVVREHPDGTREVVGRVEDASDDDV